MGPGNQVTPSLHSLKAHPGHLWLSYLSPLSQVTVVKDIQVCSKRDPVSSEARCLHQALHLSMCRKLLRYDWHLQDACRSLPQQLSLHGGWHTYACIKIFLLDLGDFQLSRTRHLGIPSSANSMIDFEHILQTSFLAKICCVLHYMNFPP